ncbi:MotA/TolQ/ExbB proton channel family protein [Rheinheimera baltica]|uniref:MotA/TolQ/ExbB proton channel family protein n=1 Tax=Rheinheimera baltica TaxID=67576 RepID=A0ABT9HXA6_9GAMM|nr:MotA/TolQ/ExbB proton channel family protein [Rheinheimera baltica]MDP5135762.1 MotA/TolQ/ExbB proton channel family protein [Rheinheimera baltica]MDP5142361.1 MotA/TolQ/ExbB proton channel family protein [Rheinheimera baltica]MDP5150737.1 MotA/TolQ/ExbB proton channel family protein [Rheinheimera baltica]MDP5188591.1 MotA/TolQ/ExbB proton channel family protein [Rheinheimera baltica]
MINLLLDNVVCWLILAAALGSYQLLLQEWLLLRSGHWQQCGQWQPFNTVLIASMPLCGLLGTIIGLLSVFANLASGSNGAAELSNGIGQALFTTQLGLTCAIPAWLLQSMVNSKLTRARVNDMAVQEAACSNV